MLEENKALAKQTAQTDLVEINRDPVEDAQQGVGWVIGFVLFSHFSFSFA